MKTQKWMSLLLAVCLLFLCACTRQRNIDTAEFCKRVNTLRGEELLVPTQFFREPNASADEYNCNFSYAEGQTALLSLKTDSTGTVIGFQLTCIPENGAPSTEAVGALYDAYVQFVTVLMVGDTAEDGEEAIRAVGILPENLGFTDNGYVSKNDTHQFAVFSGENYISLFCERI